MFSFVWYPVQNNNSDVFLCFLRVAACMKQSHRDRMGSEERCHIRPLSEEAQKGKKDESWKAQCGGQEGHEWRRG